MPQNIATSTFKIPPSSLVSKPLRKTSTFAKTLDEVYADSAYANKQKY
jgi:hypothetical protein